MTTGTDDRKIGLSLLSAEARKQVTEAFASALTMWKRTDMPRRLDDALTWVENDHLANARIEAALALLASLPAIESLEASRIAPEGQAHHIVDVNKMAPPSFDEKALEVARRFTPDTEPQRRASLQCAVVEGMRLAVPLSRVGGVPPGEWGGLSPKQAWWAGYRVGKGLPPETPRSEAVAAEAVPAQAEMTDAEIWKHAVNWGNPPFTKSRPDNGEPQTYITFLQERVSHFARAILSARKDRGDALLLKVYQHLERFAADSDIIDEVRTYLEGGK